MRLRPAAVALPLAIAACAGPRGDARVEPLSGAALGLAEPAALAAADVPDVAPDWWRGFGDPQLDRLVAEAMAGSPSLDTALARVEQARSVLSTRRAEDAAQVTLDAQGQVARLSGRYTIPPPFAGSTRFVGTGLANLGWNLDLFGRQRAVIRGARATAEAAALDLAAARLAIAGSVVQAYLDLARAEAQARIARATIAAREGSARLVDARLRNRLASDIDRQAAATLLAQARAAQVRADGDAVLARNALAALAGRGVDYAAAIAPTALRLDAGLPLPATVPADLLARRADVAAAQARVDAASEGRKAARRAFYPDINLAALAGVQAIGVGNLLTPDAGTVGAGPALRLPLFDGGRRRADFAGAAAALDLAVADYNDRLVGAVREAADGIAQVAALDAERARQAEVVRGYRETGRLNAVRVRSGLNSRLDLVDNDVRTLDAEQADAALAIAAAQARVRLALALGGGYVPQQETAR